RGAVDIKAIFGERPRSYRLYPARNLLVAYAMAGALVHDDASQGIRAIFSDIADPFSRSWYGRAFADFLGFDPASALQWLERSHDHVTNFGRWRLERRGPGHAVLHMFDEYFWIETAHRGGCEGMLRACGVVGEVNVELDGPFRGRLDVRWHMKH